jgi:hypothetical protein
MKHGISLFVCIILTFILINGCSGKVNNSVTFKNLSQGTVYVNFRGEAIEVTVGNTSIVQEIPKGTYNYSTTYSVPASATSSSVQGPVTGNMNIAAGTKILIIYSSTLINGIYLLSATISNSDDQGTLTGP